MNNHNNYDINDNNNISVIKKSKPFSYVDIDDNGDWVLASLFAFFVFFVLSNKTYSTVM